MDVLLQSARLQYVAVSEQLVDDYLVMINDIDNVARFLGDRTQPYTYLQELQFVRRKLQEKAVLFSMLEKDGGAFVGNIELMHIVDDVAELGISITAAKQNKGYGKEAIAAVTGYGFAHLGLRRIFLRVFPYNVRAIHVYEQCGFCEYERTAKDIFMQLVR